LLQKQARIRYQALRDSSYPHSQDQHKEINMTQAFIIRDQSVTLTNAEKNAAAKVLEQALRGVDSINHDRWQRFLQQMFELPEGQIAEIGTRIPRSGAFHRHHMGLERAIFNAQTRFTHFEMFRNWLKIGCGFVEWVPGAKGGIVPLPKSIAYAELEEPEMRAYHDGLLAFLRGPHAAIYLWKQIEADVAMKKMEDIIVEYTEIRG